MRVRYNLDFIILYNIVGSKIKIIGRMGTMEQQRLPRRILIIPKEKKMKISKSDKSMIKLNPDMLEAICEDKLCYNDRMWFERNMARA
jgi:ERCC4-related helicase